MTTTEPKDPTGRITQAELARRLKVSRPSVSKAVKAGRITPDEDGLFDPVEAELQWIANTRQKAGGLASKATQSGYAQARARKESALAKMAELRLMQAEGTLVLKEDMDFVLTDFGETLRAKLEALPDRLTHAVMAARTQSEIHKTIAAAAHEILNEISETMQRKAEEFTEAGLG